jgi:Glycosyltransferase family 87
MPTSDSGNRSSVRFATFALCLALVGAASMLYYHLHLFIPNVLQVRAAKGLGNGYAFGDDFYPVWLAAHLSQLDHRNPYSPETTRQIQIGLFGRPFNPLKPTDPPVDYREFAYPAFTELLVWPVADVQFAQLRPILAVLLALVTTASLWLWMLALQWRVHPLWFAVIVVLALCNYQVLEALFAEQPGLIVGFLLASAALALRRNRLLLAGVLMALTLIKPQMTLLAIGYLLLWSLFDRRRAKFSVGLLITLAFLVGSSLLLWPRWIEQWIKILFGYHRYATPPLITVLLGSWSPYLGKALIIALWGVSCVLAWRNRRATPDSPDFWWTLSLLPAITSVTLLPGQAIYDHIILFPGIFLLLRYRRELRNAGRVPRTLLAIGAVVLFWPYAAAFALIVLRPLMSLNVFNSTAVFALPIRTTASLPFAVLALLAWMMRVRVNSPSASEVAGASSSV